MKLSTKDILAALTQLPQLVFEVTDFCNLKCDYCGYGQYYNDYDDRKGKFLSTEKAIILLEYLKKLWESEQCVSTNQSFYISFYGGEPLLNMSFIKRIVTWVKQNHISHKNVIFSMTTNGVLLTRYIDFLVKHKFRLLISLDGNKKNHSYRVDYLNKNSFEKVYQNIKRVQQLYPEFFNKNVNFNAVLHNRNSMDEIYSFISEEFKKIPRIVELKNSGLKDDKLFDFMSIYKNKRISLYQSENPRKLHKALFIDSPDVLSLCIFLHQYSGNMYKSYNDLLCDEKDDDLLPTGTCLPFSRKLYVTVNGKILPCERIDHQFSLGEITNKEVVLDYKYITQLYNNWYKKLCKQCSICFNKKSCIQCMFYIYNLNEKPICKSFMDQKTFQKYISNQFSFLRKYPGLYKKIMEEVILQ